MAPAGIAGAAGRALDRHRDPRRAERPVGVGRAGARGGRAVETSRLLAASTALGVAFLAAQTSNWMAVAAAGDELQKTMLAFAFWMLTVLHGLHVLGGLVPLALTTIRAAAGRYLADPEPVELVARLLALSRRHVAGYLRGAGAVRVKRPTSDVKRRPPTKARRGKGGKVRRSPPVLMALTVGCHSEEGRPVMAARGARSRKP